MNARDHRNNDTALHIACRGRDQIELIRLLLDKGANVEAKGDLGLTPLHYACIHDNLSSVELLLENGANVNSRATWDDVCPLHCVSVRGNPAIIRLLIGAGADIHAQEKRGRTALHYACENGREQQAKLLVMLGASRSARDADGKTPADLCSFDESLRKMMMPVGLAKNANT